MDRLEIVETLKHAPVRLEEAVAGLPDTVLRFRPSEGEWSIKEVAGHLRDDAEEWDKRLYQVWAQNDPIFSSYDGEQRVQERGYQEANLAATIAAMRSSRLKTVNLLSHAVDWTRLGQQPGVGRRSLKQFAESMIDHDNEHLAQIEALQAAAGATTRAGA
jgi:uncharacterized damage-inducible protein DinB